MRLMDPIVGPVGMTGDLAPRLTTLEGKTIGLWANRKLNSTELLEQVELELHERYPIAGVVKGIYHPGRVMKPVEWGPIDKCDAVILANGD